MAIQRLCKWCKTVCKGQRILYCSQSCYKKAQAERAEKLRGGLKKLSSGSRGAVSELRVCVDLMEKHYEVFRAVSPACSCDIAILKDGELLRIECRTGIYYADGESYAHSRRNIRADILAVVLPDKIVYEPDISVQRFPRLRKNDIRPGSENVGLITKGEMK